MKEFYYNLSKATRATLIACLCFIILSFLIIGFLVLCPIPLQREVSASTGRLDVTETTVVTET